jgi:hypothetical protein
MLIESALRIESETKAIDAQILAAAKEYRAEHPGNHGPLKPEEKGKVLTPDELKARIAALPPLPAEVKLLDEDRENVVVREVETIKSRLGPEKAEQLETYVHYDFIQLIDNSSTIQPANKPTAMRKRPGVQP